MEEKNNKLEIYFNALSQFGISSQQWMLVEEIGELLNEIAKLKRNRSTKENIFTELADVHIMVEQMAVFFGWEEFVKEKERKLKRLESRLQKAVQQYRRRISIR